MKDNWHWSLRIGKLRQAWGRVNARGSYISVPFLLLRAAIRFGARKARPLIYRLFFRVNIGRKVFIGPRIRLVNPTKIWLKDNSSLGEGVRLWSESDNGTLILQEGAQVDRNVLLDFSGELVIEEGVLISEEAVIYTHDHGRDPRSSPSFSPLRIREGAWIGQRAFILPRVRYIGRNAVIGANAIVDRDVPDGATYVAAKGRLIESRAA